MQPLMVSAWSCRGHACACGSAAAKDVGCIRDHLCRVTAFELPLDGVFSWCLLLLFLFML